MTAIVTGCAPRGWLSGPLSEHWWKFLVAGLGSVALIAGVTTATGELPDGGWYVGMAVLFTALAAVAAGLVLGVAHLTRRAAHAN